MITPQTYLAFIMSLFTQHTYDVTNLFVTAQDTCPIQIASLLHRPDAPRCHSHDNSKKKAECMLIFSSLQGRRCHPLGPRLLSFAPYFLQVHPQYLEYILTEPSHPPLEQPEFVVPSHIPP